MMNLNPVEKRKTNHMVSKQEKGWDSVRPVFGTGYQNGMVVKKRGEIGFVIMIDSSWCMFYDIIKGEKALPGASCSRIMERERKRGQKKICIINNGQLIIHAKFVSQNVIVMDIIRYAALEPHTANTDR
jgi:hypothetical protein